MSGHADTIRKALVHGLSEEDTYGLRSQGLDALDALLAENQRLRDALERIESFSAHTEGALYSVRGIARDALAGDAE